MLLPNKRLKLAGVIVSQKSLCCAGRRCPQRRRDPLGCTARN